MNWGTLLQACLTKLSTVNRSLVIGLQDQRNIGQSPSGVGPHSTKASPGPFRGGEVHESVVRGSHMSREAQPDWQTPKIRWGRPRGKKLDPGTMICAWRRLHTVVEDRELEA